MYEGADIDRNTFVAILESGILNPVVSTKPVDTIIAGTGQDSFLAKNEGTLMLLGLAGGVVLMCHYFIQSATRR